MIFYNIKKYVLNGFWLLIPIFLWNIIFIDDLPSGYSTAVFWKDIPPIIGTTEGILRFLVFALPVLIPLSIKTPLQKIGIGLYLVGVALYFLSWVLQIYFTQSAWSTSLLGFLAPAYTTMLWFTGIGLIGSKLFFNLPYSALIYISISAAFVFVHTLHVYLVYSRF